MASFRHINAVIDALLLVCLLGFVAAIAARPAAAMDEDVWWHLRTGDWIRLHGAVPATDSFAAPTIGHPWVAYTWLFDVLVSRLYAAGGLHGILVFTVLAMLAGVALLTALLARFAPWRYAILLAGAAFVALSPLIAPRPWLFSILFLVVELFFLLRARGSGRSVHLVPLIPLFALWANLHIQFVYGLAVMALFAVTAKRRFPAFGMLLTCTLATLLNPYGWRLWGVVAQYAFNTAPLAAVQEMQAMRFRGISDWAALLLVCAAFFSAGRSRKRSGLMLTLLLVACYSGFRTARDVWFLAIVAALLVAFHCERESETRSRLLLAGGAIAGLFLAFAVLQSAGLREDSLRRAVAAQFPEDAVRFIESRQLAGPLYNSYDWGGYLIWRLPSLPVAVDGRANLHGDSRLSRFASTFSGSPQWSSDPDLLHARTILLERASPLSTVLAASPRYRVVYQDATATVFQPN